MVKHHILAVITALFLAQPLCSAELGPEVPISPKIVVTRTWNDPRSIAEIAWNGSEHVPVWLDAVNEDGAAMKLRGLVSAMRFNCSGISLSLGYSYVRIAAALSPTAVTFAWVDDLNNKPSVMVAQTTPEGVRRLMPRIAVQRSGSDGSTAVQIGWDGSEYVLLWPERNGDAGFKLLAIRLDPDLRRIDSEPFDITAGPAPLLAPQVIRTSTGLLIAYSRADDSNGGAPRAFMRTLDRIPTPPHRRAVGR